MRWFWLGLLIVGPVQAQQAVKPLQHYYRAEAWRVVPPGGSLFVWQEAEWLPPQEGFRTARIMTWSALGWGLGAAVGGYAGYVWLDRERRETGRREEDAWVPIGTVLGIIGGGTFGAPAGAHFANQRQGLLFPSMAASVGLFGVSLGLAAVQTSTLTLSLLAASPLLQVLLCTGIENWTAKQRQ